MNIALIITVCIVALIIIVRSYSQKAILYRCNIKNNILLPIDRSPNKIIIAFDLHGVLFRHDYKKMIFLFIKSKKKWKLIWATVNPKIWFHVLKLSRSCTVPEAFIMRLAQQHATIKELLPTIITIMNAQIPHAETIELVHTLKYKGYQLHVISNIGETIYRNLEQLFPEILSVFDNVVVTSAANGYISKPNPKMYYTYLSSIDPTKTPLFIDDKIKNINSALTCGMASIYYQSFDQITHHIKKLLNI